MVPQGEFLLVELLEPSVVSVLDAVQAASLN